MARRKSPERGEIQDQSESYDHLRFVKDEDMVSRSIDGETILVAIRERVGNSDSLHALNEVGSRIWELIDGNRRVIDIREEIVKKFEVDVGRAGKDLISFLSELEGMGVIKRKGVP